MVGDENGIGFEEDDDENLIKIILVILIDFSFQSFILVIVKRVHNIFCAPQFSSNPYVT